MEKTFTVTMKKKVILDFIKENGNKGFSQGELTRHLMNDLMYVSVSSARVSISNMMSELEKDGLVYFEKVKPVRGRLDMKVWYLKDGIQKISGEE